MLNPLRHPEIQEILNSIDRTHRMIVEKSQEERTEIETARGDLILLLGQKLYELHRTQVRDQVDANEPGPIPEHLQDMVEDQDENTLELPSVSESEEDTENTPIPEFSLSFSADEVASERWYTDELSVPSGQMFFGPEDHLEEYIPLPDPIDSPEVHRETPVGALRSARPDAAKSHQLPSFEDLEDVAWKHMLLECLYMTQSPKIFHAYTDLAAEHARLHWATYFVSTQISHLPRALQASLLKMLASRCRHLEEQLEVPVGPQDLRNTLETTRHLLQVGQINALDDQKEPEYRNWFEDAQHWWDVVVQGVQPESLQ
jgi:hypothetical protein